MPEVWKTQARYRSQIDISFDNQHDALHSHVYRMPVGRRGGTPLRLTQQEVDTLAES